MAAAIATVFFVVVTKVEKQLMVDQATFVAQNLTASIVPLLSKPVANSIAAGMTIPGPSPDDAKVLASNAALRQKAIRYVAAFTVAGLALFYYLSRGLPSDQVRQIVIDALVLTGAVAATEVAFSTLFARTFLYADPNVVRHAALLQIQQSMAGM